MGILVLRTSGAAFRSPALGGADVAGIHLVRHAPTTRTVSAGAAVRAPGQLEGWNADLGPRSAPTATPPSWWKGHLRGRSRQPLRANTTDRAQHSAARPHRRPVAAEQRRPDGEGSATAEHEATAAPWDRWRTGRGRNRACTAQLRQAPGRRACRGGTWPHGSRGVHPLGEVAPRRTASLWRGAMPSSCSSAGPGGTRVNGSHPSVGTVGGGVGEHPVVETAVWSSGARHARRSGTCP